MKQIWDALRSVWVKATPEEVVRQTWIYRMVGELKFPRELLVVERELKSLPDVTGAVPERRIDILSYRKTGEGVTPLLIMECKEGMLRAEALEQVMGYNFYIKAPYVAVANMHQVRVRSASGEMDFLPTYAELCGGMNG